MSRTDAAAPADRSSVWQRLKDRLTSDDESIDARHLQDNAARQGATACRDARVGELVTASGRLRSVVYTPGASTTSLSAELFDGSGSLQLVWLGQRRIPGIEPGRSLMVRGRIAEQRGVRTLFNPWYELIAG